MSFSNNSMRHFLLLFLFYWWEKLRYRSINNSQPQLEKSRFNFWGQTALLRSLYPTPPYSTSLANEACPGWGRICKSNDAWEKIKYRVWPTVALHLRGVCCEGPQYSSWLPIGGPYWEFQSMEILLMVKKGISENQVHLHMRENPDQYQKEKLNYNS